MRGAGRAACSERGGTSEYHRVLPSQGRQWLMKWLPSRAYDNNVFVVFSNGVGIDGPEVRPGCSMVLDPDGLVLAECTSLAAHEHAAATLRLSLLDHSLAASHVAARRPSLYAKVVESIEEVDTRTIRNRISGETIL